MGRSVQAVSAPDSGSKAGDSLVLRHVAPVSLYDKGALASLQGVSARIPTALGSDAAAQGPDTTKMDSLQLAIYHHNKAIDDSLAFDSLNRQKKNASTPLLSTRPKTH